MILVLGVWNLPSRSSRQSVAVTFRTSPCAINWTSCSGQPLAFGSAAVQARPDSVHTVRLE